MISVDKHDMILYAKGVSGVFNDPDRLKSVEDAVNALERGESVTLLLDGNPTGTIMRAQGPRYIEEKSP